MKIRLPTGRSRLIAALVISILMAVIALWPLVFSRSVPVFGDNVSFWAPNTHFWTSEVKAGRLPTWNPHILSGVPFAADINHGLFYPPHWISLVLSPASALAVLAVFHVALAAFGMYLFLEHQGLSPMTALWGGVVFSLSAAFLPLVNHIVMLESMSYLPLILYAVSGLTAGASWRLAALAAGAFALCALAGDVHATYIAVIAAGTLFVFQCAPGIARGEARSMATSLLLLTLAGLFALLLASAALLPAAQLASWSVRGSPSAAYASYHGLDLVGTAGMITPGIWGTLRSGTAWNFRWDQAVYLGVPLCFFAGLGLRRPGRAIPVGLIAVGAGLAFGASSPLWRLAYNVVPSFGSFRQPREYFIIAVVGMVILAARGVSVFCESPARPKGKARKPGRFPAVFAALFLVLSAVLAIWPDWPVRALAGELEPHLGERAVAAALSILKAWMVISASIGLLLAASALRNRSRLRTASLIIALTVIGDVTLSSSGMIIYGPADLLSARTAAATAVTAVGQGRLPRFAPDGPGFGEYFARFASRAITGEMPGEMDSFSTLASVKRCLPDNESLYVGIDSVLGYSTFIPRAYSALYLRATGRDPGPVRLKAVEGADYRLLGANVLLEYSDSWENPRARPLGSGSSVFMAYNWRRADSFEQASSFVSSNPQVVLTIPVVEGLPESARKHSVGRVRHSIEDFRRTPASLSLVVYSDEPGLLVLTESMYPGWRARVNGVEVPIFAANLAFRALYLGAGRHEVEMAFQPVRLWVGIGVSLVAVAGLALGLVVGAFGRRRS